MSKTNLSTKKKILVIGGGASRLMEEMTKTDFSMKKKILIIGGGASGLMAAIQAAAAGASVTVLEQNEKPGKKIAATGNGRCNFSNLETPPDAYRGTHPEFVREALAQFSVSDTISFFERLGIGVTNKNGYLYPRSGQASSVTEVLCMEARNLGVKIKTNEKVIEIRPDDSEYKRFRSEQENTIHTYKENPSAITESLAKNFNIENAAGNKTSKWRITTETWQYEADAVILAGGSKASAISGADGSCYALAESLGHRIIKPLPALTALKCRKEGKIFALWSGVRTEGTVTLRIDDSAQYSSHGELQLTDYGVSGIPVFQVSRYAVRSLEEKKNVTLTLDFLPEMKDTKEVSAFLEARRRNCPYKNEKELLTGLFPEKLIRVLTAQKNLADAIHAFPLTVTGSLPFEQAQVCSGGVDTSQVNSETMESLLHPGLYFAGELLDIDGTCGGYNLQWAWSSGACAGRHAACNFR